MDHHDLATRALDAAIEVDRAIRGASSDLSALAGLADALDAAWASDDPIAIDDLVALLPNGARGIDTVSEAGAALAARWAILRAAAGGGADGLRAALDVLLSLHRTLLAQGADRFRPYGLAA